MRAGLASESTPSDNENAAGVVGLCVEVNDLAISKYIAGRPKDLAFTRELANQAMTKSETLMARLNETDIAAHQLRELVLARIYRDFGIGYGSDRRDEKE